MTTLYRKYRPQSFSSLAGQEFIVQTIMNEVAMNKIAHAYLFSGPRGVGKTTMARLLAKAVNCERRKDGESEPCNECTSCQEITVGRHIDVLEIDAASQTGVDNVRENIIDSAQFKPTKAKYKVFIVDEVHMLSTSAFNALLKTLEEPPAHVIFILATTEMHKLPATVISRCQRFTFKKIPYEQMLETLKDICKKEEVKVDEEILTRIITKSDGGMRDAESLLGQILSMNLKKVTVNDVGLVLPASDIDSVLTLLTALQEKTAGPALELIQTLSNNGTNLDQFMLDCLDVLRTMMVQQATGATKEHSEYSKEQFTTLKKLTTAFTSAEIISLIDAFLRRRLEIRTAPVPQLPLELLIVQYTNISLLAVPPSPTRGGTEGGVVAATNPEPKKESETVPEQKSTTNNITSTVSRNVATAPQSNDPQPKSISSKYTANTTLERIVQKWNDLIAKVGETNHSLTFVMKMCRPKQVDDAGLLLTVPYSLHKEKIDEPKSRRIIEDAMEFLFAERIPVYCQIESEAQTKNDLDAVAANFGGEVLT